MNPTLIESKISFGSFLTLGLLEFGCIIYGYSKYMENPFLITHAQYYVDKDDYIYDDLAFLSYDIIFIGLLIYGAISSVIYVCKGLVLIIVFIYFKIYGGLEDDS